MCFENRKAPRFLNDKTLYFTLETTGSFSNTNDLTFLTAHLLLLLLEEVALLELETALDDVLEVLQIRGHDCNKNR